MTYSLINNITYYISKFSEKMLSGKSFFTKKKTMLIVRLDSIGDYILYRNFIKEIKESQKYSGYKITILGNIAWKDIAETYDREQVDRFIWVDKEKFGHRSRWKNKFLVMAKIHFKGFEILMLPNDSKTRLSDYIIKLSGAKNIINDPSDSIFFPKELDKIFANKITEKSDKDFIFQFNRNKLFTEEITGKKINIIKPSIEERESNKDGEYIVLFPGAGHKSRRWSPDNFAEVCSRILRNHTLKIIICGDSSDKQTAEGIISAAASEKLIDMTGRTKLPQLISLIKNARLLISNETCAIHIAASVNTAAICISNGNHFGRFNPYPENIAGFIKTIYPEEITNNNEDYFSRVKKYHINSDLNINKISSDTVYSEIEKLHCLKNSEEVTFNTNGTTVAR